MSLEREREREREIERERERESLSDSARASARVGRARVGSERKRVWDVSGYEHEWV